MSHAAGQDSASLPAAMAAEKQQTADGCRFVRVEVAQFPSGQIQESATPSRFLAQSPPLFLLDFLRFF